MRVFTLPAMLPTPCPIRKEDEPLTPPESIERLPSEDRKTVEDIYTAVNRYITIEETSEEVICRILMARKKEGRDIILAGHIIEKVVSMKEDRVILLEELEWTYLKKVFFPEDHGKKEEDKVFQGFQLTAVMYPILEAIEDAKKENKDKTDII